LLRGGAGSNRTMSRRLALTTMFAIALVGGTSTALAATALHGRGFTTTLPDGWTSKAQTSKHVASYALTPSGASVDVVGIPTSPGTGATIGVVDAKQLAKGLHRKKLPSKATALLPLLIGTPRAASDLRTVSAVHGTRLAGAKAAAISFSYRYHGRDIVQRDIVSRRGPRVYYLEADSDSANDADGRAALATITHDWRWR
jgi:hypothetical protein